MAAFEAHTLEAFASTKNYREFLEVAFKNASEKSSRFSYAAFARKAGFKSRSFPRDTLLGKKNLSYDSALKFCRALELSNDLKEYFLILVSEKNSESPKLAKFRKRILSKADELKAGKRAGGFPFQVWLEIYAALGTNQDGASFQEIQLRTQLPEKRLEKALSEMAEKGFLTLDLRKNRYIPVQSHLIFNGLGDDQQFKQWYLNTLQMARRRAEMRFKSEDWLFFNSVFSVNQNDMPALKRELREVILRFVDTAENPVGNRLGRIQVSLFN